MPKASRKRDKNASTSASTERQQRSCIRCNERKIKCDRANPCGACCKSGGECIFPPPQRASRMLNRPPVPELLARLRELETEVEQLRSTRPTVNGSGLEQLPAANSIQASVPGIPEKITSHDKDTAQINEEQSTKENNSRKRKLSPSGFFFDFYIPNHDWSHETFFRDYLKPSQITKLWQMYQSQVAPVIALLHRPQISQIFHDVSNGSILEHHEEALFLSVCFAAIASMTPEQCLSGIGHEYPITRHNFEIAVSESLNQANFITSQEIMVVQAAVLYLLSSRLDGDSRRIWAQTAILIRVAQGQKLHRDGTKLRLPPFECEVRRRLWWHICILDMLVSEDQDVPRQIHPDVSDTQFPTNIDDDDLTPDMREMPEQGKFTNITLCIITAHFLTELHWMRDLQDEKVAIPLEQKKKIVQTLGKQMEEDYLQHFQLDIPIQWMTATIARLHLSRAWLFVHLPSPSKRSERAHSSSNDLLFRTGIEVLEFVQLLRSNPTITNWSWLWKSYREWHVMAYVISELIDRPLSPYSDHAWDIVTKMYSQWQGDAGTMASEMAKPLARLMQRTVELRAAKMGNAVGDLPCVAPNTTGGMESQDRLPTGMDLSVSEDLPELSSGLDWGRHRIFGS